MRLVYLPANGALPLSDALQIQPETAPDSQLAGVHSEADRYDGSRTSAEKQLLIWQLSREGRSVSAIAEFLEMKPYTVKAVIARKDSMVADARMLLKANSLEFVHNAIEAAGEAAKRGKLEGIAAMLDRLDVTQPPKGQQGSQVAVQINLHGGPEPVSLAKVQTQSEGVSEQAQISEGLIMQLMDTAQPADSVGVSGASIPQQATTAAQTTALGADHEK